LSKPKRLDIIVMATIFRVRGLRVVIYSNDHWPPHVHVVGPDREAKIALSSAGGHPGLVSNHGLSRSQLASVLVEIDRQRDRLMRRWREIHDDA
jgi:hypothetical protein